MIDYLSKNFNLTLLDLIVVGLVGGLLVNLFSNLFKWLFEKSKVFFNNKIKRPFNIKRNERSLQRRIKNDDINMKDAWTITKKKDNATEEESKALENFYKREWEKLPQETKEQSARISENIRDSINRIHKDL